MGFEPLRHLKFAAAAVALFALTVLTGCGRSGEIDDAALRSADTDGANWLTYGRTYSEQRFSPLKQIDENTVGHLGLVWSYDLGTRRGLESTPLVKDGVLYATSAWSLVYAMDSEQRPAFVEIRSARRERSREVRLLRCGEPAA